jgi:hypothetical protein
MVLALLLPIGRYEPYPYRPLAEREVADACGALPGSAVGSVVGAQVAAIERRLPKTRTEVENLFPSISHSGCSYRWPVRCPRPNAVRELSLEVIDMPDPDPALVRYNGVRNDLEATRPVRSFRLHGRSAYDAVLDDEVLIRVLDRRFIVDAHVHYCGHVSTGAAQAAAAPLATRMMLPIAVLRRSVAGSTRRAGD